jgi:hypothetical protein
MKGVPEADIAAATGNWELTKRLIMQNYGPGSAPAPARTGYAPYGSGAGGSSFGESRQRVYPGTSGLDDARARQNTPAWGGFTSEDSTGLSAGNVNPYRADANNSVPLNYPSGLFVGPGPESGSSQGPPLTQPVGFECQGFPAGCQFGGDFGGNANHYAGGRDLCRKCAIRYLGIENEPPIIQIETLRGFEKK